MEVVDHQQQIEEIEEKKDEEYEYNKKCKIYLLWGNWLLWGDWSGITGWDTRGYRRRKLHSGYEYWASWGIDNIWLWWRQRWWCYQWRGILFCKSTSIKQREYTCVNTRTTLV